MTYKTMDWDAEAQRIAGAFGYAGTCYWITSDGGRLLSSDGKSFLFVRPDLVLSVFYSNRSRDFTLSHLQSQKWRKMGLILGWNGVALANTPFGEVTPIVVRALFHLDLLTAEVEAALKVDISTHQKIEWGSNTSEVERNMAHRCQINRDGRALQVPFL